MKTLFKINCLVFVVSLFITCITSYNDMNPELSKDSFFVMIFTSIPIWWKMASSESGPSRPC